MAFIELFEQFEREGTLILPQVNKAFCEVPWSPHPTFEGVALKNIVTASDTDGQFSFHLVRIAPHQKIGLHHHDRQLETHEIIAGEGQCLHNAMVIPYAPGVISIFPMQVPHEITAGKNGLYLFAKFMPALC